MNILGDTFVVATCGTCKRTFRLPVFAADLKAWHEGKCIQDAMPYLNAGQRELLISGTCGECFEKLFAENPDEN